MSGPDADVRRAVVDDAETIALIHGRAMRAAYRHLLPSSYLDREDFVQSETDRLATSLSRTESTVHIWLAPSDAPCGYVVCGPSLEDDGASDWGAVYDLFVDPSRWGRNVGRGLLEAAEADLAGRGCRTAILHVYKDNTEARAFYERLGWRADGREFNSGPPFELETLRYRTGLGTA
jgi:ribosomal protein S18 acetylase RimI-like enzyme